MLTHADSRALLDLVAAGETLAAMASNAGPDQYVEGRYALRTAQNVWDKSVEACQPTFEKLRALYPEWSGTCFGESQ